MISGPTQSELKYFRSPPLSRPCMIRLLLPVIVLFSSTAFATQLGNERTTSFAELASKRDTLSNNDISIIGVLRLRPDSPVLSVAELEECSSAQLGQAVPPTRLTPQGANAPYLFLLFVPELDVGDLVPDMPRLEADLAAGLKDLDNKCLLFRGRYYGGNLEMTSFSGIGHLYVHRIALSVAEQ